MTVRTASILNGQNSSNRYDSFDSYNSSDSYDSSNCSSSLDGSDNHIRLQELRQLR